MVGVVNPFSQHMGVLKTDIFLLKNSSRSRRRAPRVPKHPCAAKTDFVWWLKIEILLPCLYMQWIVVGLGNPGGEYAHTRHNTGRMCVEFFAKKIGDGDFAFNKTANAHIAKGAIDTHEIACVLPDTFMNKSGAAVGKFVKSVKAAERLVVCYDDLDLPIGKLKLSFDRGSGGHKGVESIMRAVKTKKFVRVRIGVSPATPKGAIRKPHGEKEVNDFILAKFRPAEMTELQRVFTHASEAIAATMTEGRERAMNIHN